jgi:hypothetical protein
MGRLCARQPRVVWNVNLVLYVIRCERVGVQPRVVVCVACVSAMLTRSVPQPKRGKAPAADDAAAKRAKRFATDAKPADEKQAARLARFGSA